MGIKKIVNLFEKGSVCVTGVRGTGKDMLMSNVVVRRALPYISNIDYGGDYIPLKLKDFDIGNTYENFFNDEIKPYLYPHPDLVDLYISDCGVYFPAQDFKDLNKKYEGFASFQALCRQIGLMNLHFNAQNLNRVWDKLREQSEIYIRCNWCHVLFKCLVIQKVTEYEYSQSCVDRVPVFPMKRPIFNKYARAQYEVQKCNYRIQYGIVKPHYLVYINRSTYDTRRFKTILEQGGANVEKKTKENI